MKNLPKMSLAIRFVAAIAAVGVTFVLLDTLLTFAAPQRDLLIAKTSRIEHRAASPVAVAMLSTGAAGLRH